MDIDSRGVSHRMVDVTCTCCEGTGWLIEGSPVYLEVKERFLTESLKLHSEILKAMGVKPD